MGTEVLKGKKKSSQTVKVEEQVIEHVSRVCRGSSIAQDKKMLKECEKMLEEKDEAVVNTIMQWSREPESSVLFTDICHEVLNVCPYSATPPEEKTEKRKPKSETPEDNPSGPVYRVVAATWMKWVINDPKDWITFHYADVNDRSSRVMGVLQMLAKRLEVCDNIVFGSINVVKNDIPPPFWEYARADTIALWGAQNKYQPAFMKDLEESDGYVTPWTVWTFIQNAAQHPDNKECMADLQESMSQEEVQWLRSANQPHDEL